MYMLNQRVVSATAARANFFNLLERAENGEDVIIVKKDSKKKFKLVKIKDNPKPNKELIIKQMGEIGLRFMSPEEIKKILVNRYE